VISERRIQTAPTETDAQSTYLELICTFPPTLSAAISTCSSRNMKLPMKPVIDLI